VLKRLFTAKEGVKVREAPNGGTVRVKDVARVEFGTQDYSIISCLNGKRAAVIAVYQLPGTNAVQTVESVRKLMAQMKQRLPQDIDYVVSLDQTAPVTEGIKEILEILLIAIVLVILVVYLFLQDWRATLIPLLAVQVSLVGTFVLFPLFGFSINTLSLFGLGAGHWPGGGRRHCRCGRCSTPHRGGSESQGRGSKSHG
jgi:HAE1 family hydrophobic/amphiphilic exporter-1